MITFRKILFPVDFSEQCTAIVPAVRAMAQRFDSELIVLHVVDLPSFQFGPPEAAAWSGLINAEGLRAAGRGALERFITREFPGTPVTPLLAEGDAARGIVDSAEEGQADLVMIPTHGYGVFRALLLGSVAAKVLHDSACPVWTSVHTGQLTAHPPERWKRMMCAVDADPKDLRVLTWAAEFASEQGAQLRLVHAVRGADPQSDNSDPAMYQSLFQAAREQIEQLQAEAGTNFEVCLLGGIVSRVVHRAATGHESDLIVIGRGAVQKPLGRLRNNAYSIIREAPCPVLSI